MHGYEEITDPDTLWEFGDEYSADGGKRWHDFGKLSTCRGRTLGQHTWGVNYAKVGRPEHSKFSLQGVAWRRKITKKIIG